MFALRAHRWYNKRIYDIMHKGAPPLRQGTVQ